jgi:hypothetical protein
MDWEDAEEDYGEGACQLNLVAVIRVQIILSLVHLIWVLVILS